MKTFLLRAYLAWKKHRKLRQMLFSLSGKVLDYPETVFFELTNHCNYDCIMCPKTQIPQREREKGFMNIKLFKKGIDNVAEIGTPAVALHGFGESMLHPEFLDFVRYAKDAGIPEVFLFTNGSLLNEDYARELIEIGLDRLAVSFEGATSKTHESVDRGSDYKRDKRNVERLIEIKDRMNKSKPIIEVNSVLLDKTRNEIEEIKKMWGKKADVVSIQTYMRVYADQMSELLSDKEVPKERKICTAPATQLMVYWDGKVSPCCGDCFADIIVGDLREQNISEIWRGEKINRLRNRMFQKKYDGLICEKCEGSYGNPVERSLSNVLKAGIGL